MRYCLQCGEEYRDEIAVCDEDGSTLVDRVTYEATMAKTSPSLTRLTTVATFEDRFEADELAQELADAEFNVAVVSNKPPTMGSLVDPSPAVFSIVVPEDEVIRATPLIREWSEALERSRGEAEQAAEMEEATTEQHA